MQGKTETPKRAWWPALSTVDLTAYIQSPFPKPLLECILRVKTTASNNLDSKTI